MKKIIYVSNYLDKEIQVLNVNDDYSLCTIQKFLLKGYVQPLATSKNYQLLYAGIRPDSKIITFQILKDGQINKIHEISLTGFPNHISLNRNETLLFCSSYHGECVNVFSLDSSGVPFKLIHVFENIKGCHYSTVHNNNKIMFTTALKSDQIFIFNINNLNVNIGNSALKVNVEKNSGPRHIAIHPNGYIIYSINEFNSTIDVWSFSEKFHKLQLLQRINILPEEFVGNFWASDIHVAPCGNYLYASDRSANILTVFIINKIDKKIKVLEYYVTEQQPRSFDIDYFGKFLTVVGEKSNSLTLYKIRNNKGHLNKVSSSSVGKNPIWSLIHRI